MADSKNGKVFYFIAKPDQGQPLELWLMDLRFNPEFEPKIVVERFAVGSLKPGVDCMIDGYSRKPEENVDGFVEFNRELDVETDPAIKQIKENFCVKFVPFQEGSSEFKCKKAVLPPERTIMEWFSKNHPAPK